MANKVSRITGQKRRTLMKLVHTVVQVGHELTTPQPVARLHQTTHHCLPMQTSDVLREPPKHSPRRSWRLPLDLLSEPLEESPRGGPPASSELQDKGVKYNTLPLAVRVVFVVLAFLRPACCAQSLETRVAASQRPLPSGTQVGGSPHSGPHENRFLASALAGLKVPC